MVSGDHRSALDLLGQTDGFLVMRIAVIEARDQE
jgi:hypothetical protein